GEIKDYLRGTNPRIVSRDAMVKTTPAGRGSRLLRLLGDDEIHARHVQRVGEVPVMVTGAFDERDLGVACYHSKLGAVELYLNHLVDGRGEYVVV
ncbi:ATP-binding protein, partial [Azospirillum brasilense]